MHQLFSISIPQYLRSYSYGNDESPFVTNIFAVCAVLFIIGCVIYLFMKEAKGRWEDGVIPKNFKPTRTNLFEIYIAAGCAIIARDPDRNYGKFAMVNAYLRRHFPKEYYHFADSYKLSLIYQVKIDSLTSWCNKHLDSSQKAKLLNFLVELAVNDGFFTEDEKKYIYVFTQKLHLTFSHVEEQFKKHFYAEEKKAETRIYSSKQRFFEILGLSESATIDEIKTAYRKLAKMTHPDRYMNESVEVQEKMKRQFQEIQEAYEQIAGN